MLEVVNDVVDIIRREQYHINSLESCDKRFGYNLSAKAGRTTGYRHTEAAKARITLALKNRVRRRLTETEKDRLRKCAIGRKQSAETRQKIRAAMMGRFVGKKHSAAFAEACRLRKLGHKESEETKRKKSLSMLGQKHAISPEGRARIAAANSNKMTAEVKAKIRASVKATYLNGRVPWNKNQATTA